MDHEVTVRGVPTLPTDQDVRADWHDVGDLAAVVKARRTVVETPGGGEVVVIAHDDMLYALDNICIHKQRQLHKGVVLNGRLVCPGHQWAFDLGCGWEAVKQQCQPSFAVRVNDGDRVEVDLASRSVVTEPPGH